MRIGELVKFNIGKIFQLCERESAELMRLMDADYSRLIFGLAWPFCADANTINAKDHCRYWITRYAVADQRLRVGSQWYDRHWDAFCDYLAAKQIAFSPPPIPSAEPRPRPMPNPRNSRFGSIQIGDAQNAFIRFILSRLGEESFDERDWQETKGYFGNGCAYCDVAEADHMDHGIPINRTSLGEHRLGNIIPACKKCNIGKHQKGYREHLRDDLGRIEKIETYMASRGYVPLGENDQVKGILEQAHKEVAALATRYIELLNMILVRQAEPEAFSRS